MTLVSGSWNFTCLFKGLLLLEGEGFWPRNAGFLLGLSGASVFTVV